MSIENFIKTIETDSYRIRFNMRTGMEITTGINGHDDPWVLEKPLMLDIGIMGSCPNKCVWCYQGDNKEPHMSIEDYKWLIWNLKDSVNQVALGGRGNPDEHPNLYEILAYTRQCGVIPNYTTAGNNFDKSKAEMSRMTGATAVSMYHKPYTFNAIKLLMDAGVKTNIHWMVSTETLPTILDLLKYKKDVFNGELDFKRLNAIVFLLFKTCGRGADHPEWVVPNDSIKEFAEAVRSHKGPWKIGMDSCMVGRMSEVVGLTKQERIMTDVCEGSRMSCYVTPDMNLLPCSFGKTIESGVNLKQYGIEGAWNSELFNKFRSKLVSNPYECPWRNW